MNQLIEYHEYACIFDMMTEDDLAELVEKMKKRGFRKEFPIVRFEGKILDGRNRYVASMAAGVEPLFREFDPATEGDPLEFVWDVNVGRRHLTPSQRAMAASRMAKLKSGNPCFPNVFPNCDARPNSENKLVSQEEAAEKADVSSRSVKRARIVQDSGVPDLVKAVDAGEVTVNDAAKIVDKSPEVQQAAIEAVKSGKAKTVSKAAKDIESAAELTDEEGHIVPDKCRAAFESLENYQEAASLCRSLQKILDAISRVPGGEQLAMCLQPTGTADKKINKSEHVNAIKRELNGCRPHAICPYCAGSAKAGCKGCSSRGWVTATTWRDIDESVKAKLKCA